MIDEAKSIAKVIIMVRFLFLRALQFLDFGACNKPFLLFPLFPRKEI